ncbi:hypothetical protein Hamer_G017711 [Homarus americanus]|uniref:Uncharacterized protein n=1 Tax=Homarus americanus TaxID=6706 RepID=A0A8J5MJV6_HOMAM|nr:hypothetical protein Hamer_G017711 [Homarus americanus]
MGLRFSHFFQIVRLRGERLTGRELLQTGLFMWLTVDLQGASWRYISDGGAVTLPAVVDFSIQPLYCKLHIR